MTMKETSTTHGLKHLDIHGNSMSTEKYHILKPVNLFNWENIKKANIEFLLIIFY